MIFPKRMRRTSYIKSQRREGRAYVKALGEKELYIFVSRPVWLCPGWDAELRGGMERERRAIGDGRKGDR